MIEDFHFLRPYWLLALPLFMGLVAWYLRGRSQGGVWQQVVDQELLPFLVESAPRTRRRQGGGLVLAGLLAILALAGPTWERVPVPVFRQESGLVIALDLSSSMKATDLSPSRLARARYRVTDLLDLRRDGQTALVVFAAQSFVVTPLTTDSATLLAQLQGVDPSIMPAQGSEPGAAIALARELLDQAGIHHGHVLLVTDGANPATLDAARATAAEAGLPISVLGIGTREGAPIPDAAGGFIKDSGGEIVVSALDPPTLASFAASTGGIYLDGAAGDTELERLLTLLDARLDAEAEQLEDLASAEWREFGPWLLLPLIPLAALGFRRGALAVLLAGLILPPQPARAAPSWWLTPDQAGAAAFERGDFEAAREDFADPAWRGAADYRAGNYESAVGTLEALDNPQAHYNRGNALARSGRYQEAIEAYEAALDAEPGLEDAAHNKALIEELLENMEPPPEQQGEGQAEDEQQGQPEQDEQSEGEGSGQSQQSDAAESESQDGAAGAGETPEQREEAESGESQAQDAEQEQTEQAASAEERPAESGDDSVTAQAGSESEVERAQATEQWLRQIPDDPAGLLRRKFQYQYKQRYGKSNYDGERW